MGKNWSIKVWIAVLVNVLLLITTVVLSLFFYREFQHSLNERVLLQLTSIKRLKRIQIEDYLKRQWEDFENGNLNSKLLAPKEAVEELKIPLDTINQVYDLTPNSEDGKLQLAFVKQQGALIQIATINDKEIQRILLERTGMGQSGESYIVGQDRKLRTQSRFYPNKKPIEIICDTEGVQLALQNGEGRKLIKDYRGIPVFSAFHTLEFKNIKWIMLSEIDVEEALKPLYDLRTKLLLIFFSVLFLGFISTMIITTFLSQPINRMKRYLSEMAEGNFDFNIDDSLVGTELIEMYQAFKDTVNAMKSSISFSNDIGNLKLDGHFEPYGENDMLGKSLVQMRNKLKDFTEKEAGVQLEIRQALIEGEEKERQRLSAELHDGIGPMLTSLKLLLQSGAKDNEQELKRVLDQTVEEVRRITFNLMPQSLIDFGLKMALHNFVQILQPLTDAEISFTYHAREKSALSKRIEIALFRLTQEALHNAVKHASAENITLVITEEENSIDFYCADDGKGFDVATRSRRSGLSNMQVRVESLRGSFNLQSGSEGTTINANIPLSS